MIFPMTGILSAARSRVSSTLIDERAWERILWMASGLPDAATTHYLECRLAAGASCVDYQFTTALSSRGSAILAGPEPEGLEPFWRKSPTWTRVRTFLVEWHSGSTPLSQFSPIVGMEFDLEGSGAQRPLPQVGFCVYPAQCSRFTRAVSAPPPKSRAFQQPIEETVQFLRGRALSPEGVRSLRSSLEALPEGAPPLYVIAMLSRPGDVIRCVPWLPRDAVLPYLERLGWQGLREVAREVLERDCPPNSRVKIDVDINGHVLPKFAVACEFTAGGAAGYARMPLLLDDWVQRGLCSSEKRDALLAWPGQEVLRVAGCNWPVVLRRTLDCKLTVWPDGTLEAKAYLGLIPQQWLSTQS